MSQSAKMTRHTYWISILCIPLFLAGGCTTPPQDDGPLTRDEMRALLARAKNPRSLYLTVFDGPAGPEFENAHRIHIDQVAQEHFIGPNDQPCIIKVHGSSSTPITALLDPSTPESWASLEMKHEIPLTPLGPPYYQVQSAHLADTEGGFLAHASAIKIQTVFVDSALFTIRNNTGDLGPFARGIEKPKIDLALGHQFLQAFSFVRFDYPNRTVSFSSSRAFPTPGPTLLAKLPLHIIQGALGTEALINGQETKVLLDLAGNYSAAVPEDRAGKDLDLYLGDLALSGLEPVSFESLGLTESDYPRLGWQAIRQFVITLDYQRQVIWFERP
jgi:hypothetical protein